MGNVTLDLPNIRKLLNASTITWCFKDDAPEIKNDDDAKRIEDSIEEVIKVLEEEYPLPYL